MLDRAQPEALQGTPAFAYGVFLPSIGDFIGTVQVPFDVAGPLRVHGLHARGDYWVPLAATEARRGGIGW